MSQQIYIFLTVRYLAGLSLGGFLDKLRQYPELAYEVLEGSAHQVTADEIFALMRTEYQGEVGSELRTREEAVEQGWRLFIIAAEGETLGHSVYYNDRLPLGSSQVNYLQNMFSSLQGEQLL